MYLDYDKPKNITALIRNALWIILLFVSWPKIIPTLYSNYSVAK